MRRASLLTSDNGDEERVFITRVPNPIQDTSVLPRLHVNPTAISREIHAPRIGVAEVGVPYVEPVEVASPPMRHARPIETILNTHRYVPTTPAPPPPDPSVAPAPWVSEFPDARVYIARVPNAVEDTSVAPKLPVNSAFMAREIGAPRVGVAEVGVPYVEPVEVAPPPMVRPPMVETIIGTSRRVRFEEPSLMSMAGDADVVMNGVFPCITYGGINPIYAPFGAIVGLSADISIINSNIATLSSELTNLSAYVYTIQTDPSQWALFPAVSTINASGNAITNISSLQLDDQVLTALSGELLLNGVPIATIPNISNVADWALYPALSNIDANNYALQNVSGFQLDGNQVSTLGNTILVNGFNPVSNWAAYQANASLDMAGYPIFGTPSVSISGNTQNVALTASGASLLVDGQVVYTGALPPSDISSWSLYPAVSDVNMSGKNILGNGDLGISANNISLAALSNIYITQTATTKSINMTGNITQCNAGAGSNYFQSEVQVGSNGVLPTDNLGVVAIYGGNVPVGLSTFYVKGGCTLDGNLTNGHTIGCLPAAGINTQRIDVLPVGIEMTTPTFITMNGLGAANIAMGGAVAVAAGSYVTLEAGTGLGQNGVFVQNTARDSNAKLIFTGGGTLYNATEVQASNIVNPLGVRFYDGVYNPSGGSIIVPAVYGRAIVDLSTSSSYFATLTGGDLPTTKNSNSVFVGNFPNLTTSGAASTIAIGDNDGMIGQGANAIAIGTEAGSNAQGSGAVAIGFTAGSTSQQPNAVAIGYECAFAGQRQNAVAIGTYAGRVAQGSNSVAIGLESASNTQGNYSVAIGWEAGQENQGSNSVAIGVDAAIDTQGTGCVAVGVGAGGSNQGNSSVCVGQNAGYSNLGSNSVAVGAAAAGANSGTYVTAIGYTAGQAALGSNSVALGAFSSTNGGSFSNTIVVNATGASLDPANANACYIAPVAQTTDAAGYQTGMMRWNSTTKEVSYAPQVGSLQVVATSGTAINLLPTAYGKTFVLTGTTTQDFTTTSLTTNDVGWFCVVHNGNATNGGDINLTGMTGTAIIHEQTSTQNGGSVYLYWNGTGLVGY